MVEVEEMSETDEVFLFFEFILIFSFQLTMHQLLCSFQTAMHKGLERKKNMVFSISDLYYKPMTIVNADSKVINKLEASLTDDARAFIYDHHMFIVQATELFRN
jgi:hypothetical protein